MLLLLLLLHCSAVGLVLCGVSGEAGLGQHAVGGTAEGADSQAGAHMEGMTSIRSFWKLFSSPLPHHSHEGGLGGRTLLNDCANSSVVGLAVGMNLVAIIAIALAFYVVQLRHKLKELTHSLDMMLCDERAAYVTVNGDNWSGTPAGANSPYAAQDGRYINGDDARSPIRPPPSPARLKWSFLTNSQYTPAGSQGEGPRFPIPHQVKQVLSLPNGASYISQDNPRGSQGDGLGSQSSPTTYNPRGSQREGLGSQSSPAVQQSTGMELSISSRASVTDKGLSANPAHGPPFPPSRSSWPADDATGSKKILDHTGLAATDVFATGRKDSAVGARTASANFFTGMLRSIPSFINMSWVSSKQSAGSGASADNSYSIAPPGAVGQWCSADKSYSPIAHKHSHGGTNVQGPEATPWTTSTKGDLLEIVDDRRGGAATGASTHSHLQNSMMILTRPSDEPYSHPEAPWEAVQGSTMHSGLPTALTTITEASDTGIVPYRSGEDSLGSLIFFQRHAWIDQQDAICVQVAVGCSDT
eukprot:gene3803-13873_t